MNRLISVAPMMDWTDRHDRFFLRLIAPHVLLYTEMVTAGALLHGDKNYLLQFDPSEHPLALQLGGNNPQQLASCAQFAEDWGYDEVNLNVGCPSDRVQSGQIGACLMLQPERVGDCVNAMHQVVKLPITVKCRIGVDDHDSYEELVHFIKMVAQAGCQVFIIHARKAWLKGLSPKENREIPPLQYDVVRQIKKDFPHLTIIMNGGIKTLVDIDQHLTAVDGVMIGREAYSNPYFLAQIEQKYFSALENSRTQIITKLLPYIEQQLQKNTKLSHITRHILGLFHGQKGANKWRRYLSEHAYKEGVGVEIVESALRLVGE
jgi:tRNA-dihydrouridine synthase A